MICSCASVKDDKLKALQRQKKELGKTLPAFSCHSIEPAQLTEEQIDLFKSLENNWSGKRNSLNKYLDPYCSAKISLTNSYYKHGRCSFKPV